MDKSSAFANETELLYFIFFSRDVDFEGRSSAPLCASFFNLHMNKFLISLLVNNSSMRYKWHYPF